MTVKDLQRRIGATADGVFGPASRAALFATLTNKAAPALTDADTARAADGLGVVPNIIRAVRTVEAPRGAFDADGRPSILYERHVFSRNSAGAYDGRYPTLSARKWQPGTYGPFSAQYRKLADACALDPGAAFKACSWGAFQVLGENAEALGYDSAFDMAIALTASEAAHLESFVRFVKSKGAVDELRACRAGDARSCEPFVSIYNGVGQIKKYAGELAKAAL